MGNSSIFLNTSRHGNNGNNDDLLPDYRTIDGSDNNLSTDWYNPVAGSDEITYGGIYYANCYSNDMITGLPDPRMISNIVSSGPDAGKHDSTGISGWGYVFGQFTDHDIDLTTSTGGADMSLTLYCDPYVADGTTIPLTRANTDPNNGYAAINSVSGWLDASQVYGSDTATVNNLRLSDGHMKTSDGDNLPIENGVFIAGDTRVMENPELTGNTLLFVREHNFQVDRLAKEHPNWTGDQLYQQAKAITTAEFQKIVFSEFLPAILGSQAPGAYHGYDPNVDPRISEEFSFAAFRFGHSTVSDEQTKTDNQGNVLEVQSLASAMQNGVNEQIANGGLDALLRSLSSDGAQNLDVYAIDGLRNTMTGPNTLFDLIATDIQRERDVGLGTLNQTRMAFGLQPYQSFSELTSDPVVADHLQQAYGSIDRLDLFMGGLAEDRVAGSGMGETFGMIIRDQFERLRDGDQFWWQNQPFDAETQSMIENSSLSNLVMRNTDTTDMQQNAFIATERHLSDVAPENPNGPQLVIGIDASGATIAGGPADDTLVAGTGSNQFLTGNGGSDLFLIDGSGHSATITDFDTTFDTIEFKGDAPGGQPVQVRDTSDGALLTFNGNQITLAGLDKGDISSSNLTFLDSNALVTNHGLVPA